MLEVGDTLHTWALRELPRAWRAAQSATTAIDPGCPAADAEDFVDAEQLGDHRHTYLNFEGPLTGDRGHVRRIDSGTYVTTLQASQEWHLKLEGGYLRGEITLTQSPNDTEKWLLRCGP
jgi:hypothetical protein